MKRIFLLMLITQLLSCQETSLDFITLKIADGLCIATTTNGRILAQTDVTNSVLVINKAIDKISENGVVFLESGAYPICDSIILKSNIHLVGEADSLTILEGNNSIIIRGDSVENLSISNLTVKSSKKGADAIYFTGKSDSVLIEKVIVRKSGGAGIRFRGKECQHNIIRNCIIEDCEGGEGIGLVTGAGNSQIGGNRISRTLTHGIIISGGSNCVILNNYVEETGFYRPDQPTGYFCHGIAVDGNAGQRPGKNHIINKNTIVNAGAAGIEIADGIDSVIIRYNYIIGTGIKAPWDKYGIYFGGSYYPGIYAEISQNEILNCRWSGIRIDSNRGENGYTENVRVDSNYVSNIQEDGILVGATNNIKVRYNKIDKTQGNGIRVEGLNNMFAVNILITNNKISEAEKYGIYIDKAEKIDVDANLFSNNVAGNIFRKDRLTK